MASDLCPLDLPPVSIYQVSRVCLMLSSTNTLLFAYPTVAHLITLFSTRSFLFFTLSSDLYIGVSLV